MKTLTPITCQTCLYMATHDKCDGCLHGGKPFPWPDEYDYKNWTEGNWMARVMWFELEGKRNIVIGGQGEAEVNTKTSPGHAAKHLHYVAEQCGYMCGRLNRKDGELSLMITTTEGLFRIVWDADGLKAIETWAYDYDYDNDKDLSKRVSDYWNRDNIIKTLEGCDNSSDPVTSGYKQD